MSSCTYLLWLIVDQTRAIAPFEPEHFSVGTACGSGTPDGSRLPVRNFPSEDGSVAHVNGRIGWIAVSDDFGGVDGVVSVLDVGAAVLDCAEDDGEDGEDPTGDGGDELVAGAPPDDEHPLSAAAPTAAAPSASRKIT